MPGEEIDREFEFMLAGLNQESSLLDKRLGRIEQIVAFYIAILTALIAAIALIVSQASTEVQPILLVMACAVAATNGAIAFFALSSGISQAAISHTRLYGRRQYFLDKYQNIHRYFVLEDFSFNTVREIPGRYFNKTILVFLKTFAGFNATLVGFFFVGAVLMISNWISANLNLVVIVICLIIAAILALVTFRFQTTYLEKRELSADVYNRDLVDHVLSNSSDKEMIQEAEGGD